MTLGREIYVILKILARFGNVRMRENIDRRYHGKEHDC